MRRLQEAQDNLLRLFDEVRGFAAPIQLERTPSRLDSIWHEAWQSLETSRRDRDAKLVEDCVGTDLTRFSRPLSDGAGISEFAGELVGGVCRSVVIQSECRDAQLDGSACGRNSSSRQWAGTHARGSAKCFRAVLHDQDEGNGPWHGDCKKDRRAHGGEISVGDGRRVRCRVCDYFDENFHMTRCCESPSLMTSRTYGTIFG